MLPREVRTLLGVRPGDTLAFHIDASGVRIERAARDDDTFATFDEWAGKADDEVYQDL
ncbi:MAG: AbrB/MazE/SpoVT family DNA-binding domain-containing protein [Phycisphaerales bacterium]|nr:AbrB/MazE/SpoVT family DNA-binding domain-containing protein [Hyphomonadaceae bacterium]